MTTTVSTWDELRNGVQADILAGGAEHIARRSWNSDQFRAAQRQGLTRLLAHAAERSPFHARGRDDEIFHYPDGTAIHPIVIRSVIVATPQIVDYQVAQTSDGISVSAVTTAPFDADAFTMRVTLGLVGAGHKRPGVRIRLVDRLDRHPGSGKFRRFVPV
jgi:hypothetical protein